MAAKSRGGPFCILGLLLSAGTYPASGQSRELPPVVFTQLSGKAAVGVQPGEAARLMVLSAAGSVRPLDTGFHSAADPEVSFDGKRILFAGKRRAGDKWQIFEMNADGSSVRQVTRGSMDCRSPAYQSKIYSIIVEQPWYQVTFVGHQQGTSNLYSVKLDGSGLRRLSYNPFGDLDPHQMQDGRILFAARQPGRLSLFAINLDGTDFALFSGPEGPLRKRMPCVTTGRLAVFVETEDGEDGGGTLGAVSLRRNLHSYRKITSPADGSFHSPSPLPNGQILAARRTNGTYSMVIVDPDTGQATSVYADRAYHSIQPKAITPRPEPDGRSSVVDETDPTGKFYCLSVYTNDLPDRGWLRSGVAERLRVVEAVLPGSGTRLLGEFNLEQDGSFHIQTPANTPIQFQVVDREGMALRSCTWVWNKNKEQRGCIGCHEDGELAPENRFAQALARPAIQLTLPPERRRTVELKRDVEPVLQRKCATSGCHAGKGFTLRELVRPGNSRTSPLVWSIYGHSTARPWDRLPEPGPIRPMPPPGSVALTPEERRTIIEWIDLGAQGLGARQ